MEIHKGYVLHALQAAPATPDAITPRSNAAETLHALIASILDDNKAEDVIALDTRDKSSVTDVMMIASGRSARHVSAIADYVIKALKEHGAQGVSVEGLPSCDWVLIDAGDVVLHLFRPEVRAYYNLEKMWGLDAEPTADPAPPADDA